MTKEEARQSLFNTKVYVDGKSKEIQEKLFKLGFKWADNRTCVRFLNYPFLFFNDCGIILCGHCMGDFTYSEYKEIPVGNILNLEWDEEFKPFDKVLGRDADGDQWRPDFFQKHVTTTPYPYQCIGTDYKQCIPYEGNEDKLK